MSSFWTEFHVRAAVLDQEKTAIVAPAALHLLQNSLIKQKMKSPGFAKTLAHEFQQGVAGKSPSSTRQFLHGVASSVMLPEAKVMRDHSREIGGKVMEHLRQQGVSHLSGKDILVARAITQGKFSKLLNSKHFDPDSPTHKAFLEMASQHLGVPITSEMFKSMPKADLAAHMGHLEHAWQQSPFTKNLVSGLTKNPGKPQFQGRGLLDQQHIIGNQPIDLKPRASFAGNMVGAGMVSAVDPLSGAVSAGKTMITNETGRHLISKVPGVGQKALAKGDKFFFTDELRGAAQQGLEGKRLNPALQTAKGYGVNAMTSEMAQVSNNMGHALHQTNPTAAAAMKQHMLAPPAAAPAPLQQFRPAPAAPVAAPVAAPGAPVPLRKVAFFAGFDKEAAKVFAYRNIRKGNGEHVYSVRTGGKVQRHTGDLVLAPATFKVSDAGRDRVRAEGRKNVHAGVEGDEAEVDHDAYHWRPVTYNPKKNEGFVDRETGEPVGKADAARLTPTGVLAGFAKAAAANPLDEWMAEAKDESAKAKVKRPVRVGPRELSEWQDPGGWPRTWQ